MIFSSLKLGIFGKVSERKEIGNHSHVNALTSERTYDALASIGSAYFQTVYIEYRNGEESNVQMVVHVVQWHMVISQNVCDKSSSCNA